MIIRNLNNGVYLAESNQSQINDVYIKLFTTDLSIDELQSMMNQFRRYVINEFNPNDIHDGSYSYDEIINHRPLMQVETLFSYKDNVKYPILIMMLELNGDKDDLTFRFIEKTSINHNRIKQLDHYKMDVIFKYLERYLGEEIDYYE